jgi:hypothetical protein
MGSILSHAHTKTVFRFSPRPDHDLRWHRCYWSCNSVPRAASFQNVLNTTPEAQIGRCYVRTSWGHGMGTSVPIHWPGNWETDDDRETLQWQTEPGPSRFKPSFLLYSRSQISSLNSHVFFSRTHFLQVYFSENVYRTTYNKRNSSVRTLTRSRSRWKWISGRDRFSFYSLLPPERFWGKRSLLSTGCWDFTLE